jgi:hypothetical protein
VGGVNEPPPSATPEVPRQLSSSELEPTANQRPLIDFSEPSGSKDKPSVAPENEPVKIEHDSTHKNAPFGGSLSLARVQSLVSMTTPRDGNQEGMIRNPPFVEFDLSIDGFACLFLPSVFPQSIAQVSEYLIHRDLPKREMEVWYCITINYAWVKLTFVSGLPSACSRKILWGPVYAKAHFRGHARSCPLYMYMYIVQPCLFRGFKHVAVCRLSAKSTKIGPLEKFLLYCIHLHTAIKVIYFSSFVHLPGQ